MQQESTYLSLKRSKVLFLIFGLVVAVISSYAAFAIDGIAPLILAILAIGVVYLVFLFRNPRIGLTSVIIYCFTLGFFGREVGGLQYGLFIEVFLILTWIASLLYFKKEDWSVIKNDLSAAYLGWFIFSFLQVINPAGANPIGWLMELRSEALYPILIIPMGFMLIKNYKDLDHVIKMLLLLALIAALNGIKQAHIGMFPGEQAFIDGPGGKTHLIFGKLRAFSFYDAGQFGGFEAVFITMAVVLSFGTSQIWKKILLLAMGGTYGYAMLLSGTRGAFFALVVAAFVAIFLTKNFKILILGGVFMVMFLGVLKFTSLGSGIYSIQRFRTSLDPNDPSLNVRFQTQRVLREYMSTRPFGGGLGVLGAYSELNKDKFLSTVQPDSFWVKIWAMTGIVGLTLWFGMIMYILGKCSGIIWMIKDAKLKIKLIAMLSSAAGIFFCSYGNEVINNMPSSLIFCISLVLVYIGPAIDREISDRNNLLSTAAVTESTELELV